MEPCSAFLGELLPGLFVRVDGRKSRQRIGDERRENEDQASGANNSLRSGGVSSFMRSLRREELGAKIILGALFGGIGGTLSSVGAYLAAQPRRGRLGLALILSGLAIASAAIIAIVVSQ